MSIREMRQSKIFRIISFFLLINFLTGQNFYGTEFQVQEGTGLYAPTVGVAEKELETGGLSPSSAASDSPASDFLDDSPLSAAESLAPVSTVAPDPALASANLTNFSGSPWVLLAPGSSSATRLVQQSAGSFFIKYDVSSVGSKAGVLVSFDNPTTPGVETQDLSLMTDFVVGLWGPPGSKVRLEIKDLSGATSEVLLVNLSWSTQYYRVSKTLFTGVDWTKVKQFIYSVDKSLVTTFVSSIGISTKTLLYTNELVTNFPATPHVEVGEAANVPTQLVQSSANGFKWNYDVTAAGSVSSASVVMDNPATSAVETADLSGLEQFTFGIWGPAGSRVRLEFEDASGAKSSVLLENVQWTTRYYTFGKDAFSGLDWTKIERINFVADKTMVTALVSGFGIQTKTLLYNSGVATNFPNSPFLEIYEGSSPNTNLMQMGTGQFRMNYDVSQAGSVSGASVVLDNPATSAVETADLSAYEQFSFGMWSTGTTKLKVEFEDASGMKSSAVLTGINPALQYFILSKGKFAAGVDWTKIRKINFLVDPSLVTSLINTIWIQAKTLTFNAELLTSFPGSPRAHIMPGSTPETLLRQTSNTSLALDFSLSGAGTQSGAGISFDNPNTPSRESRNLSSFKQFVFSAGGVANGKLKIEMEDTLGRKSSTVIHSLSTAPRYYTLSRDLFSSIDLAKVLRITFSLDSTLSPVSQGTLTIGTRTLLYNGGVASWLRGTPSPMILEGSSTGSYLISTNPWVMNLRYDVSAPGSVSGVSFSADNPLTSAVETSDLLYDSTLRIGIKASSSSVKKIRLEIEDDLGGKASLVLTGLTTSTQYYAIQESLLAGVDWTRVTRLNLVLDPSLISSGAAYKGTIYLTINGFLYTKTIAPSSGLTAANLTTLPAGGSLFLLPGSSAGSTLSEGNSQLNLGYDLTTPQSISGARVNYDNPSTPAVETGNFSGLAHLVFGLKAPSTMVRVKLTDLDGHSASVFLTDVSTTEKFFSIPTSSFTGVDLTRIRAVDFLLDPFVAGQAPATGNLQVSLKGLVPPVLSVPTVDAVPALTNQKKLLLSGTKSPGTGIAVNGKMILVPTDATTWQAEADLDLEGDNALQVQETTGAGVHGPVNEIHVFLDTIPPSGSMVINDGDPYTDSRDVTLALTASDGGSDLEVMRFSIDGGNQWFDWESVATLKALRLPQWDGAKEVLYQLRDHAGNIATFSDSIILETGVPQIIVTSPAITNRTDYTFTYVVDGVSKSRSENLDQGDGDYTLSVTEPDDEGNIATVDFKVTLNTSLLVQPKSGIFTIDLDSTIQGATEIVSLMKELSKKFLSAAQDAYDFLVFVPTFSTAGILQAVAGLTGWGVSARKPVEGIGRSNFDTRPAFGSSIPDGELEHTVYFYSNFSRPDVNIGLLSNQTLFNWVFLHELGHYWLQTLSANGNSLSNPLGILAGDSHWSPFFNAGLSPMRGFEWIDNGDGTFTVHHGNKDFWSQHPGEVAAYNDFDLYAMGLLSPEEVRPSWVIDNPTLPDGRSLIVKSGTSYVVNADGTEEAYQLFAGDIVSGERREITIQDILAIEGPRFPQHPFTQKDFSLAFVVVDDPAADPSDWIQTVTKLNQFAGQTQSVWEEGTARRAGIDLVPTSVSEMLAPEIDFSSPAITNDPNYTLVYTVNGVEKREDIILQEGKNTLIREAIGTNGKRRVASFTVTLDTVPPLLVQVTGPTLTNASEATFTWEGTDSEGPIASYRWRLRQPDGTLTEWMEQLEGEITLTEEISVDGTYELQFQVVDTAGNSSDPALHSFIIDRTAPSVTLTSPILTNQQVYTLNYSVTDNVDAERVVTEQITLLQGSNVITRTVTDTAGNSRMLTWTVDFLPVDSVFSSYDARFVPFEWITTTTATGITLDDQGKSFTLPFSFQFFGQNYTQIQVSSNGFVQFGSCSGCTDLTPDPIPISSSPNAIVAPLWRDLHPGLGGTITYLASPTQFVVSWNNVPNLSDFVPQRFQLILNRDGNITFQYATVTSGPLTMVGLEDPAGMRGTRYTLLPNNGIAVKFTPFFLGGALSINQSATYATSREVTLSLQASSPNADLEAMRFSTDDGSTWSDWEAFNTTKILELPKGDGSKGVLAQVTDRLGFHSEHFSDSIILDTVGPAGSLTINNNATHTNSLFVTLNLGVYDTASGLDQMRISLDEGLSWTDWETFAFTKTINLSGETGTKEVWAQVKDQVNHISDFTDTIALDTTLPLLQDQNLATFEDVRKVIILGPRLDQEGDFLTYSYEVSADLVDNGEFVLFENQLTYIPNTGFIGSGTITIQATDGFQRSAATINLEVKAAQLSIPNDPDFSLQYSLDLTRAARAWNLSHGAGVNVAIIDTGIKMSHPDLAANIFTNAGEIAENGIDDDDNGFIDDVHGWNFVDNNNNPSDREGHGTHVAGIAAAKGNNGIGISGLAPDANLIPIKTLPAVTTDIDAFYSNVAKAIKYAVELGAKVINMSLSRWTSQIGSGVVQLLRWAVAAARRAGVVVVASAGNDNADVGLRTPAAIEGVITVAATDSLDRRYSYSNYGDEIEVAAPGVDIYSTWPSATYYAWSGTSMSSPLVAGLAALILSQDPEATDVDVLRRLKYSSVDLGTAGWDPYFGFGRIDAFKALSYDYYDDGTIKTQWLEEPDEYGYTRLDFDTLGRFLGGAVEAGISALSGLGASLADSLENLFPQEDLFTEPLVFSPLSAPSLLSDISLKNLPRAPLQDSKSTDVRSPSWVSEFTPLEWDSFRSLERNEKKLQKTTDSRMRRKKAKFHS